jgi:hypothetical protein
MPAFAGHTTGRAADALFGMLPKPDVRAPLASTSPLNTVALDTGDTEQPVAPDVPEAARR